MPSVQKNKKNLSKCSRILLEMHNSDTKNSIIDRIWDSIQTLPDQVYDVPYRIKIGYTIIILSIVTIVSYIVKETPFRLFDHIQHFCQDIQGDITVISRKTGG